MDNLLGKDVPNLKKLTNRAYIFIFMAKLLPKPAQDGPHEPADRALILLSYYPDVGRFWLDQTVSTDISH